MPLTGICPHCGTEAPIEAYLTDTDAREAMGALLALLPERERRVIPRYAALFAPSKQRVQWPKLTRVLRELTGRIESGQVTRRGQVRACSRGQWLDAVEAVLANHEQGLVKVPLPDHAYLDAIAWDLAGAKPGSYTAPPSRQEVASAGADRGREAASTAAQTQSPAQLGSAAVGLRRQIERLEHMGIEVPEALREQLAAAQREAG